MKIEMIGIDYQKASVGERERFALTVSKSAALGAAMVKRHGASGCVALSTCNRTELWCSGLGRRELQDAWRKETGCTPAELEHFFVVRSGMEAVQYLLELGCGLHSQILGEDQVLAQIKSAAQAAREGGSLDPVLDTLFRVAATAGKRVKSAVRLTEKNLSVPQSAVEAARRLAGTLRGKRCLVIGNGEMGRLTCRLLAEAGANVLMTLRQYKKKDAVVPKGCQAIPYEERYRCLSETELLFSATLSPHYTIEAETLSRALHGKKLLCFDLAMPRDIDPEAGSLEEVSLYDLDRLGVELSCDPDSLKQAEELLSDYAEEFERWYHFREFVPVVGEVSAAASALTAARLEKTYKKAPPELREQLRRQTENAVEKSFAKLLYGLREHLDREHWKACLDAVQEVVEEWREEEGQG